MGKDKGNKAPMPPALGYHVIRTTDGAVAAFNIVGSFDDAMIYQLEDGRFGHIMNSAVISIHPQIKVDEEEKKESE